MRLTFARQESNSYYIVDCCFQHVSFSKYHSSGFASYFLFWKLPHVPLIKWKCNKAGVLRFLHATIVPAKVSTSILSISSWRCLYNRKWCISELYGLWKVRKAQTIEVTLTFSGKAFSKYNSFLLSKSKHRTFDQTRIVNIWLRHRKREYEIDVPQLLKQ